MMESVFGPEITRSVCEYMNSLQRLLSNDKMGAVTYDTGFEYECRLCTYGWCLVMVEETCGCVLHP